MTALRFLLWALVVDGWLALMSALFLAAIAGRGRVTPLVALRLAITITTGAIAAGLLSTGV